MTTNRYIDTRGLAKQPVRFSEAIIQGLAQGGGLYVPESLPHFDLDEILCLAQLPYWKRAAFIYKAFQTDLEPETIDNLMQLSYGEQFDTPEICPLTSLDDQTHILELWHGPTSAFKDMALQCLPNFFSQCAEKLRGEGKIDTSFLILVATSGDTGKGALEGFKNKNGIKIAVLYPDGGVSDIQYKQMATQEGNNVQVWAVSGNFDDCQTGVKAVFNDKVFEDKLRDGYKVALSSANSINWGRLLPQIVYYVSAYACLVNQGKLEAGRKVDVCVPTGNFGNILAAWYAKQLGTPIDSFICASNENKVLTDFINSGTYDISKREFVSTPSPSMDILVSSNVERQLFELSGRRADVVRAWMEDLNSVKTFTLDDQTRLRLQADFRAGFADNQTCLDTIKKVFDEYDYLLDPHTAVAFKVACEQRRENPIIVASTAHWAKFGNNVYRALHNIPLDQPLPDKVGKLTGCQLNALIAEKTGKSYIPTGLAKLDSLPIRFSEVIGKTTNDIEDSIEYFLS